MVLDFIRNIGFYQKKKSGKWYISIRIMKISTIYIMKIK